MKHLNTIEELLKAPEGEDCKFKEAKINYFLNSNLRSQCLHKRKIHYNQTRSQ